MPDQWGPYLREAAVVPFLLLPLLLAALLVPSLQARCVDLARRMRPAERWLILLLAPVIASRLSDLGADFATGADSFRVLQTLVDVRGALTEGDLAGLVTLDGRHPPLFYWLLYPLLELAVAIGGFGTVETAARIVPALAGVLGVVLVFELVRAHGDATRALLVALLLGFNTMASSEARNVSDASLFLLLTLWSLSRLLRAIEAPTRRNAGWLLLANLLLVYSNLMAVLWLCAELVVLLVHARTRAHRYLWWSLVALVPLALPVMALLWDALAFYGVHQVATHDTHPVLASQAWAAGSPLELYRRLGKAAFGSEDTHHLMMLAVLVGHVFVATHARRSPFATFLVVLPVLVLPVLALASRENHMREEYLAFVLAPAYASTVLGLTFGLSRARRLPDLSSPALIGRAFGWSAVLLFVVLCAHGQHVRARLRVQGPAPEVILGRALRAEGASHIAAVFLPTRPLLVQYTLTDPVGTWRACRLGGARSWLQLPCRERQERLTVLMNWKEMRPGWERVSVERWLDFAEHPHHFVYTRQYPNPALMELLQAQCEEGRTVGPLTAFRCPGAGPGR